MDWRLRNDLQPRSFKPYYKWNTFNTDVSYVGVLDERCFKPYYKWNTFNTFHCIPPLNNRLLRFKPYYKWNTFNTR